MKEAFSLRIDIDTYKDLKEGVPNVLNLLSRYNIKASFFCTMGWEGDIISVLRHRILYAKKVKLPEVTAKKQLFSSYLEFLRCLFLPKKISKQAKMLKKIVDEGHDLGVHAYIHTRWHNPTTKNLTKEFNEMIKSYEEIFNKKPIGFASPLFTSSNELVRLIDKYGFLYASFLEGEKPFQPKINEKKCSHIQIPVNIRFGQIPPILYFSMQGLSQDAVAEKTIGLIDKKIRENGFASTYIHPVHEGMEPLLTSLTTVIRHIKNKGYLTKTYEELALDYKKKQIID